MRHARLEHYQIDLPTPASTQRRDALLVPITNPAGAVTHLFYRGADITELIKKEQELQDLNTELERKVAAHPDCIPPDGRLFLGEAHETIPLAASRDQLILSSK